jgi:hypothetical protein
MSLLDDPTTWRARAAEARAMAASMKDPRAKRSMLEIAVHYDLLAERAAKRQNRKPKG